MPAFGQDIRLECGRLPVRLKVDAVPRKLRHIRAGGHGDQDRIRAAFALIVASERRSQSGRLDAYDSVPRGVEIRVSLECIDSDRIRLQRCASSCERAFDDEGEKRPQSLAAAEDRAEEDLFQSVSDILAAGGRRDSAAWRGGARRLDGRVS